MTPYSRNSKYGPNLRAFVVYLLIELRLSNKSAAEHVSSLFGVSLQKDIAHEIKSDMAEKYLPTYRGILRQIAKGALVHVDETKGVVKGGGHFVWVFTNMTTVAYVYAESREADILKEALDGVRCADAGAAGTNRSAVAESSEASECAGASGSDGDPGASGTGAGANGAGEHGARVGQELRRAIARMQRAAT